MVLGAGGDLSVRREQRGHEGEGEHGKNERRKHGQDHQSEPPIAQLSVAMVAPRREGGGGQRDQPKYCAIPVHPSRW
jgi:hypothetical protein